MFQFFSKSLGFELQESVGVFPFLTTLLHFVFERVTDLLWFQKLLLVSYRTLGLFFSKLVHRFFFLSFTRSKYDF